MLSGTVFWHVWRVPAPGVQLLSLQHSWWFTQRTVSGLRAVGLKHDESSGLGGPVLAAVALVLWDNFDVL